MKYLINDEGRECTCCGEFKQWDEYRNHKISKHGKRPVCRECEKTIQYIDCHGCLKEDNIDTKHYDADKIMDKYINRKYREKRKFYKELFKKEKMLKRGRYDDLGRECNRCGKYKYWGEFNRAGNGNSVNNRRSYCKSCQSQKRKPKTREQRYKKNEQKKKLKANKIKRAIELANGNIDINNGFIYLYRCEELDCFKIGRTKDDPFEYVSSKSRDYGLDLEMVAYIVSPIRDCDAEWLATKDIKHKKIKHKKPYGGYTHELFKCGLYEALLILRGISDKMYIEPNPFVSLDDLGAVEIDVHVPSKADRRRINRSDGVIARRMLRDIARKKIWNVDCGSYISACECCIPKLPRSVKQKKDHWVVNVKGRLHTICKVNEITKDEANEKVKILFDIRDNSYVNGRYINDIDNLINKEVIKIRREVRGIMAGNKELVNSYNKAYQKIYREAKKLGLGIKEYRIRQKL